MTDEEYVFNETNRERKRNGYGDRNKKRQGGRYVHLPSDKLTKKEKEAMNGMVVSYSMNKPVKYPEFSKWPKDIKLAYVKLLATKYGVRGAQIQEMLGCGRSTWARVCADIGYHGARGGRTHLDVEGWNAFLGVPKANETAETVPSDPAPQQVSDAVDASCKDSILNIAFLLESLKGTGARITIEVTL